MAVHSSALLGRPRYRFHRRIGIAFALMFGIAGIGYAIYQQTSFPPGDARPLTATPNTSAHRMADRAAVIATADQPPVSEDEDSPVSTARLPPNAATTPATTPATPGHDPLQTSSARTGSEPVVDPVIHITNVGDRIVVSNDPDGRLSARVARAVNGVVGRADDSASFGNEEPDAQLSDDDGTRAADYAEVYPGCPSMLPAEVGEQGAAERLQLYGCRYLATCDTPADGQPASCVWYLTGKI